MAIEHAVHEAFATPIVTAEWPEAAQRNADLRASILDRMARQPSLQHSNLMGWQSSWDMAGWGGPATTRLLDFAAALAGEMTCDRQGRPVSIDWKINAWANVNGRGAGNEFHTHPGAFWSGTYYVDDGGVAGDPGLGGAFEFQDPRGIGPAMYAPQITVATPGGLSMGASEMVSPRAGLLLLFPAWLSHAVKPYLGEGLRISIAFNLSV